MSEAHQIKNVMTTLNSVYRSHTCGEIRESDIGKEVILSGWIHKKRDHGGILFVDLRDNYGLTQIICRDNTRADIDNLRTESVITIKGKVVGRDKEACNNKLPTGMIEINTDSICVHSCCDVLPFQIAEDDNAPENTRLQFRFLELRKERVHKNILLRSDVVFFMRQTMYDLGFKEFQTPILTSSSPEGARDYIVPSRVHPGKFFALPQAPQQFKQLLMVSGFDRYFQIAPCFRDEDARADRSPGEFYQLDLEMSFVEQEDVFKVAEEVLSKTFSKFSTWQVTNKPFPRLKYDDVLNEYGIDKPDLRNPLKIKDVTSVFKNTEFKVFQGVLAEKGTVRSLKIDLKEAPSRKFFDDKIQNFQTQNGIGLGYLIFEKGNHKGGLAKVVSESEVSALKQEFNIIDSTICVIFFAAGAKKKALSALGKLRIELGREFDLIEKDTYKFCFITDFPMYELNEDTNKIEFSHNPFSMPQGGLEALNTKDPLTIAANQYDVVCNGYELSSGAIRNHSPEIMYRAFEIAGYSKEDVDAKFGGMIRAFKFGAPPHGGMAPGIDRIVMLLANESAIRDVIAFPMSQTVEDLLMGAPGTVSDKQLKECHIKIEMPKGT